MKKTYKQYDEAWSEAPALIRVRPTNLLSQGV